MIFDPQSYRTRRSGTAMPLSPKAPAECCGRADRRTDQGNFVRVGVKREFSTRASAPPYMRKLFGDAQRGEAAYKTFLRILPRSGRSRWTKGQRHLRMIPFLALVSDQSLRTIVITGRPELGAPDWRGNLTAGRCRIMEITTLLRGSRHDGFPNPGQPYSAFITLTSRESASAKRNNISGVDCS